MEGGWIPNCDDVDDDYDENDLVLECHDASMSMADLESWMIF